MGEVQRFSLLTWTIQYLCVCICILYWFDEVVCMCMVLCVYVCVCLWYMNVNVSVRKRWIRVSVCEYDDLNIICNGCIFVMRFLVMYHFLCSKCSLNFSFYCCIFFYGFLLYIFIFILYFFIDFPYATAFFASDCKDVCVLFWKKMHILIFLSFLVSLPFLIVFIPSFRFLFFN